MRPLGRLCPWLAWNARDSGEGRESGDMRMTGTDLRLEMSGASRAQVLAVGRLVEHHAVPGIGRIGAVEGSQVRLDCFESVAAPVVDSRWVPADECRPATLLPQTRVYWQNPDTGVGQLDVSSAETHGVLHQAAQLASSTLKSPNPNSGSAGTARSLIPLMC